LEAVRRTPIDLVLLDLFMPGMDGFRFLEELRSNVPAQPPVVVVTQYDDVDNRNRAQSLGASEYVSKGYAFERAFVGMIRKYLAVGERGQ
jgi:CheY-like chemotaxis protein